MWRSSLLLILLAFTLNAQEGCFRFFAGSYKLVDGCPSYAVAKNRFVSIGCPSRVKVVAKDRLRGLCLFESDAKRPFLLTSNRSPLHACIENRGLKATIVSYPVGVVSGRLIGVLPGKGALFGGCCQLAGLVYGHGRWYDSSAIRSLMKGETTHGEIGVRFKQGSQRAIVESVDPYLRTPLRSGDEILRIDGQRVDYKKAIARIDRCRPKASLTIVLKRHQRVRNLQAVCHRRVGGGMVSDTFLERFGLQFDSNMHIVSLDPTSKVAKNGLKKGDSLLMIDGRSVTSWKQVRTVLNDDAQAGRIPENFLWQRDEFQFFLPLGSL